MLPTLQDLLHQLQLDITPYQGKELPVSTPIDGSLLCSLATTSKEDTLVAIQASEKAFQQWQVIPPPLRGELIRLFGETLRHFKEPLAQLVTLECGKILSEARGEVQEMIDICDFAVGLSRQLYGLTIASERKEHTMSEQWLPLGPIGIISAFNFPVAVWAWNAALSIVCGNSVIWKPSEKTPLTALACQTLFAKASERFYQLTSQVVPEALVAVVIGGRDLATLLAEHPSLPLISATGSTHMGRALAPKIASRFGRALLELGGNNAIILSAKADLAIALPSVLFGAVGTTGQRCTTTRRLLVEASIFNEVLSSLTALYQSLTPSIGNPLEPHRLIGPLIDKNAYEQMDQALRHIRPHAKHIIGGVRILEEIFPNAYYVTPALVTLNGQHALIFQETFAPILYVIPYHSLEEAMQLHNAVPQGLSSAIFTTDLREAEYFKRFSDCGIANVNIGTSGAEIGGAFGGEKETGGGRESGSDAWKNYMRRQTSTTYYGRETPQLAQGVSFSLKSEKPS